jgi:hypothetical protein
MLRIFLDPDVVGLTPSEELAADLEAFVVTEIGRAADKRLENSLPLALYFPTPKDRDEFVAAVMEAKPGMISRKWPR